MKKIFFTAIFIYVLIAVSIYNLPEIVNHFTTYYNDRDSVRVSAKNDSIKNRLQKDIENKIKINEWQPVIALSFNNNLHISKISFLDENGDCVASWDSLSIPYDNIDLSKTNSKNLEKMVTYFPPPQKSNSEKSLESTYFLYVQSLIDTLDVDSNILSSSCYEGINYIDILKSVYSEYLYIIDDSISAIKLNDVGTIKGVYFVSNEPIAPTYDLFKTVLGEETEIEQTIYRRNRPYKVKKRVRLPRTEVTTDPIVLAENECVSVSESFHVIHNTDGNYDLSHRLVCHPVFKANPLIVSRLSNKTIYITAFSPKFVFENNVPIYFEFKSKSLWYPSNNVRTILFALCLSFTFFAVLLMMTLIAYQVYYKRGKDQTDLLSNNYSLYSLCTDHNRFAKIESILTWLKNNYLSLYLWFLIPILIMWIPYIAIVVIPCIILFGDVSWKEKISISFVGTVIGVIAYGITLGGIFVLKYIFSINLQSYLLAILVFTLTVPLLLYVSLKILRCGIFCHIKYLEKTFPQSYNTCDNDSVYGLLSITQATFEKTEALFNSLAKEVSRNIKMYSFRSKAILGDTKENTLLELLFLNIDKAKLIADIPNEIKREEITKKVEMELSIQHPYGYEIWKLVNQTQLSYKTIEHAKKWSPIYEETIKNNGLNLYALIYIRLGFTLSIIEGYGNDYQSWKKDVKHITNAHALSKITYDNCTGIGVMLGDNSDIKALDFDNLNSNITADIKSVLSGEEQQGHLKRFLCEVLETLGLPEDYPWVVFSGSHKGIHILFKCNELSKSLSITSCSFQEPNYYLYNSNPSLFERVELRWKCHLVLPPSLHWTLATETAEHNRYYFAYGLLPLQPPSTITIDSINAYLTNKCASLTIEDNYHCASTKLPLALVYKRLIYSHTSSGKFTSLTMDRKEYIEWLKRCGNADALNTIGVYYSLGWGVECDLHIARNYFEKADNDASRFNLAMLISCGCLSGSIDNVNNYLERVNFNNPEYLSVIYAYKAMIKENVSKLFNLDKSFSNEQLSVITIENGHHLVLAPPGCGKTRVLAERVMHAIDNGVKLENMLCLTFTNRAAREMKERIDKRMGNGDVENLFVGNVHHFCSSLLRKNQVIPQKTTVIDDEEKTVILREVIKNCLNINVLNVEDYYNFQHLLYQLDNHYPDELITRPELKKYLVDERYIKVAREYLSYKKKYDLIDFEDLLLFGYDYLLSHKEEVNHYSWIQVDEVQDLNRLQLAIVELVTAHKNPCVVYLGDEQQAIYSFMGAKLKTLTYLKEKCHGSIHHFHGNYRSPKYLLDVFNKYAEINLHVDRALLPQAQGENANMQKPEDGLLIESCEQREGFFDGDYCSYDLAVERSLSYADGRTAILTYTNANCDKISERLERKGIEHFKISGTDFLWTKEVKLIFSHLNVFTQPENIMSWARILLGIDAYDKMEEAHRFISEANKCYLRGIDLMYDKRRNVIKNFIHDYPNDFVIFDTETTGLDVNNDDIVEIAAIRIKDGVVMDEMDIMLYTEKTIPPMLGDTVNPLPDEYKKREKLQREKGLLMFLEWVGKVPVLAHNAKYDYQILDANLKRDCGINNLQQRWQRVHDSLAIARIIEPQLSSYKLKDLLTTFHLLGNNTHLAIDDVKATKSLVDFCYKKASYIFVLQNDFFARNQVTINLMREKYGELYQHTWSVLSQKSEGVEGNIFAAEVNYAYQYFRKKGFVEELKKMKYLLPFLNNDFIIDSKDKTLQQLLDQYMMELNTLRESDLCDSKSLQGKVNVYVSTVHRAKGLEFENVVVFDVRDGAYPNFEWNDILKRSIDPVEREKAQYGIQEDARKLYVAISRAKKRLCIQYPQMNTGHGKYGWYSFPAKLSPFVERIRQIVKIPSIVNINNKLS